VSRDHVWPGVPVLPLWLRCTRQPQPTTTARVRSATRPRVVHPDPGVTFPVGMSPDPACPDAKPSSTMSIPSEVPGKGYSRPSIDDDVVHSGECARTGEPCTMTLPPPTSELNRLKRELVRPLALSASVSGRSDALSDDEKRQHEQPRNGRHPPYVLLSIRFHGAIIDAL